MIAMLAACKKTSRYGSQSRTRARIFSVMDS